jgi:hypothetical protein
LEPTAGSKRRARRRKRRQDAADSARRWPGGLRQDAESRRANPVIRPNSLGTNGGFETKGAPKEKAAGRRRQRPETARRLEAGCRKPQGEPGHTPQFFGK